MVTNTMSMSIITMTRSTAAVVTNTMSTSIITMTRSTAAAVTITMSMSIITMKMATALAVTTITNTITMLTKSLLPGAWRLRKSLLWKKLSLL